ncbi:uncharacterized protein LOC124456808 [Xenia sp. Carnegie-2017]|uniref:uncharacterized protein LOC124456808 n=1 Tax=Xenia sp. Carnegie-2017 TaxID=2897299 RepID=UPI001F03CCFC|nr:uncharacterized protein LOC124456808 [Xenia sp. Carnegie-2017]XP_046863104.1 uncharacterized protein LOC124456808 [Xenia sp. Carnegie-2017]XP_046863106.1 uncharacterized protein LOC124456808 [Xenia sp. Carnegie-2017]
MQAIVFYYLYNYKGYKEIGGELKSPEIISGVNDKVILNVLKELRKPVQDTDFGCIFKGDIKNKSTWQFDFSGLPQRKFGQSYIEQTSFNPVGENWDFYNPIGFVKGGLILLEDYGTGVFQRFAMLHKLEKNDHVFFEVDGEELIEIPVFLNKTFLYPFPRPFLRLNEVGKEKAGLYITHPVFYMKSFRIINKWPGSDQFETESAWKSSLECRKRRKVCDNMIYYGVTLNKLVHGSKINTYFKDYVSNGDYSGKEKQLQGLTNALSIMADKPERFAPGLGSKCSLFCERVESKSELVLFEKNNTTEVIQSIRLRVYDMVDGQSKISKNWRRILITMKWDDKNPQVYEIPLGGIFNTGLDYIREVKSLTTGLRNLSCELRGEETLKTRKFDFTAYLFYEMPFWKSAKISVKVHEGFKPAVICSQISSKKLTFEKYNFRLTGYFSAKLTQQVLYREENKELLWLKSQWGHVVAINFFLRKYAYHSIIEEDVLIETNDAIAPIISGTGLEDFFHYFHTFESMINTTAPFNGNPHLSRNGKHCSINCFRQNTMDPILFTTGIRIYLESFANQRRKSYRKFLKTSSSINQTLSADSLYTIVLYYGNKGKGGLYTDKLIYYNDMHGLSKRISFFPKEVKFFPVRSMFENQVGEFFNRMVVSMEPGQTAIHSLLILPNNVGVILRREYHSMVPNQKAKVTVDGKEAGIWFCSQRALTKDFSLRQNDYLISPEQTAGKRSIKVMLTAITRWETISIKVLTVLLTN